MLDMGSWGEILIIAVAALVLLGPKELPVILRTLGRWVYKMRSIVAAFKAQVDPFLQEGEIEAYMKEARRNAHAQDQESRDDSPSEKADTGP